MPVVGHVNIYISTGMYSLHRWSGKGVQPLPTTFDCYNIAYGVATISRLLKITRLFCRIQSLVQESFAKETYNSIEHILRIYVSTVYGVATISRLHKMIGLFCRISSLLQGSFAKETYHFKESTNRSHPIVERAYNSCLQYLPIRWLR